jgi:hypothetical protein
MKHPNYKTIARVLRLAIVVGSMTALCVGQNHKVSTPNVNAPATKQEKDLLAEFNKSVQQYLAVRDSAKKRIPPLSKDSTPEQIDAYQKKFVVALRAERGYAKQGYLFTPTVADYIREIIKTEFKGTDRVELRETILEADTAGVPLRVNYPYPETKELTQIPPTLLLKLPALPKEVKYRFVKRNMLLVDTDNGLIVDYMVNALP